LEQRKCSSTSLRAAERTTNAMAGLNSHIYVSNFVFHRCLRKTNLLLLWDYTNRITLNLDLLAYKRFNMQSAKETKLVVITLLKKNQYTYTILHIYFQFFEEVNTLQIQIMPVPIMLLGITVSECPCSTDNCVRMLMLLGHYLTSSWLCWFCRWAYSPSIPLYHIR
jgi:hypothetical protein